MFAAKKQALKLNAVGQQKRKGKSKYITEHNYEKYIYKSFPKGCKEGLVCENGNIIGNSYYIIVWRKTVPVRKCKINTIDQGNYYDCRPD